VLTPPAGPGACPHDGTTCLGWGDTSLVYEDDGWQGTGGRTHALVLGVGKYAESRPRRGTPRKPFETLPGAARAAHRFASYLRQEFREPEGRSLATLRLMLSPLKRECADLRSPNHRPATMSEVTRALQDWADDCNTNDQNLAILYIAGHGVALDKAVSMVFLADELELGSNYDGAINLSLVQENMGGCAAKDNIFVYDCCALSGGDVPDVTGAAGRAINKFPPGGKGRANLIAISAARVGTETFAMDERGTLLSWGLLGAHTDRMSEDALLRIAGDIISDGGNKRFGITNERLSEELSPKLKSLLSSVKRSDDGYEAAVAGLYKNIAIPDPTPEFEVVLREVLADRTPPVKVVFQGVGATQSVVVDDGFDGKEVRLPAGVYSPYVESTEGHRIYSDEQLHLVKRQEVAMPS